MSKVNTFFNAFGDGAKSGKFSSSKSSSEALDKLNKALNELKSELKVLISRKSELEAKVRSYRERVNELPKLIREAEMKAKEGNDKEIRDLKDELRQIPYRVDLLVQTVIPELIRDIDDLKSQVLFSQKAVDAYRDSPVEQRDVLLKEAEESLGESKKQLSNTIAKYESDIAKSKKQLLIGVGVLVLAFLGYKFLKK